MIFYSNINRPPQSVSSSGRREIEQYQFLPDAQTGDKKLDCVSMTDMYAKTQLSRPDDLYTLLKNSGVEPSDIESLRVTKDYAKTLIDDFCNAPRTLVEAHEVIHRAEQSFDQLPLDVKEEFDNSSGKMLKSLIDGTFEKRISRFVSSQPVEKKENVNDETK